MARKKSLCKLIGNRLVIPHDTIPSNARTNISTDSTGTAIFISKLKNHFESIRQRGTYYITPERMQAYNFDITFRDRSKNINGLQLADLAAYPIAMYVNDKERANPSFDIIKPKIYNKGTKLYGLKEFPKKKQRPISEPLPTGDTPIQIFY